MGLVRSLWQVTTLAVAGPAVLVGVLKLLDGHYPEGALFVGLAVTFAVVSEYAYVRLTGRTVGRLKGLTDFGEDREHGE